MKPKLPFVAKMDFTKSMPVLKNEALPSRQELRQQMEELKVKVTELAERNMEITIMVLKRWVS